MLFSDGVSCILFLIMPRDFFKQKVILHFGYVGTHFHGSQFNQGVPTVENHLYDALHRTGLISDQSYGKPHQCRWQSASRTDKGVHALANAVSLKLWIQDHFLHGTPGPTDKAARKMHIDFPRLCAAVNANLHPDVRVLDAQVVTQTFNIRTYTSKRLYSYVIPRKYFNGQEQRLPQLAQHFVGSRKYHNYTTKRDNPSGYQRVIHSIEVHPLANDQYLE